MTSTRHIQQAIYNPTTADMLTEVTQGRRGWVSLTQRAKVDGVSKTELANIATNVFGLVCENHGRYGLCASRRSLAR